MLGWTRMDFEKSMCLRMFLGGFEIVFVGI